jgi:hypothetical protein
LVISPSCHLQHVFMSSRNSLQTEPMQKNSWHLRESSRYKSGDFQFCSVSRLSRRQTDGEVRQQTKLAQVGKGSAARNASSPCSAGHRKKLGRKQVVLC